MEEPSQNWISSVITCQKVRWIILTKEMQASSDLSLINRKSVTWEGITLRLEGQLAISNSPPRPSNSVQDPPRREKKLVPVSMKPWREICAPIIGILGRRQVHLNSSLSLKSEPKLQKSPADSIATPCRKRHYQLWSQPQNLAERLMLRLSLQTWSNTNGFNLILTNEAVATLLRNLQLLQTSKDHKQVF